jgi:uncharacterized membrane protein YpjA
MNGKVQILYVIMVFSVIKYKIDFCLFNIIIVLVVDVTLWEAFSVQLMKYISDRKEKGPIVLILTHAQCKLEGSMFLPNFIFHFFPSETNIIKHGILNCITDNGRPNFCNKLVRFKAFNQCETCCC